MPPPKKSPRQIVVLGAGFVGVTTAVTFAERGHRVVLVDIDEKRVESLGHGRLPFAEPGLEAALKDKVSSGNVTAVASLDSVVQADFAFLCVGTPSRDDGSVDLSFIEKAATDVARHLQRWDRPTVVVKSTVPPGTLRNVVLPRLAKSGRAGKAFGAASNPEFLREGDALQDARQPDRIVVGPLDGLAKEALRGLYADSAAPYVEVAPETAEMIKYTSNAFLATKVALSNEMAMLCERLGIDVYEVMAAVGQDKRIGPAFLRAGVGFGGSCLPKDLRALLAVARTQGIDLGILGAVLSNNEAQPLHAVQLVEQRLRNLEGKRVALLGLAFKPNTSDVRESRAYVIYEALAKKGADIICYDPLAGAEFQRGLVRPIRLAKTLSSALKDADAAIVQTEWPEFREAPAEVWKTMRTPFVVDGRRALDSESLERAGVECVSIGRGRSVETYAELPTSQGGRRS